MGVGRRETELGVGSWGVAWVSQVAGNDEAVLNRDGNSSTITLVLPGEAVQHPQHLRAPRVVGV